MNSIKLKLGSAGTGLQMLADDYRTQQAGLAMTVKGGVKPDPRPAMLESTLKKAGKTVNAIGM